MMGACPTCGHEVKSNSSLTQEILASLLDYDPLNGEFRWKVKRKRSSVGSLATGPDGQGYLRITIGKERHRAHRLAWLYIHGVWPSQCIDHINRNRADNRISNLRLANKSQNGMNSSRRIGSTGYRGVVRDRKKFAAQFRDVNGKTRRVGGLATAEEAALVYRVATSLVYGEFSNP